MYLQENLKVEESSDINGLELCEELLHFQYLANQNSSVSPMEVLRLISDKKLQDVFPNIWISMRVMLTIPVTVASSERSFSKLKLIKTYMRSTMTQDRLSSLAILSTENSVAQNLDFDDIISSFAEIKARNINKINKQTFYYVSNKINNIIAMQSVNDEFLKLTSFISNPYKIRRREERGAPKFGFARYPIYR
jgi:hypothetical protein